MIDCQNIPDGEKAATHKTVRQKIILLEGAVDEAKGADGLQWPGTQDFHLTYNAATDIASDIATMLDYTLTGLLKVRSVLYPLVSNSTALENETVEETHFPRDLDIFSLSTASDTKQLSTSKAK